jgi:hypothetical protein
MAPKLKRNEILGPIVLCAVLVVMILSVVGIQLLGR